MKEKMGAALLAVSVMLAMIPAAYGTAGDEGPVLVGLAFGSSALDGANLANSEGEGYRFGYLDEDRGFQLLGETQEKEISVVKTQNVWYGVDPNYSETLKCYSDAIASDVYVGCWHVELPMEEVVADFETAHTLAQAADGFPAWIEGEWRVRQGAYLTQEEAQAAAEAAAGTVVGTSAYGMSVVKTGTGQILFQFDGGEKIPFAVAPGMTEEEKTATYFRGKRYQGIFRFFRARGGDLSVANLLPFEDYINSVISNEMGPRWPLEALKAQAVCARNYYEDNFGRHNADGIDICATTHCQAYYGMDNINDHTTQAVQETAGLRAWYQGKPAKIFYFSSDGGATEACKNVWVDDYPYLCGVIDPYEALVEDKISNYHWSVSYTASELTEYLQAKGFGGGAEVVDFTVSEYTPTGNVRAVTITYSNGKKDNFYKDNVRTKFSGVYSLRYTITKTGGEPERVYYTDGGNSLSDMKKVYAINGKGTVGKVSGKLYAITADGTQALPTATAGAGKEVTFVIEGTGWGHNVGMSQWGAYAMAQEGFSFDEILKFYFPGIEIY